MDSDYLFGIFKLLKSKVKQKEEIFGIRKTKVASQGVVSNLAKVTYA
jgi:hypothetical protein